MSGKYFKIFLQYIISHKNMLIANLCCAVITIIVFLLYDVPVRAVGYALLLCTVFLVL